MFSLLIILICFGAVMYGIVPNAKKSQMLYISNKTLAKEVDQIKKRVQILDMIDESALESYMKLLLSAVPAEKDIPNFMLTVQSIIQASQVTETTSVIDAPGAISTSSAQPVDPKAKNLSQNSISTKLNINGTKDNLLTFLNTVSNTRRLLRIPEISIAFDPNSDQAAAKMIMESYYAPLPNVVGKPSDKLDEISESERQMLDKLALYKEPDIQLFNPDMMTGKGLKANPFAPIDTIDISTMSAAEKR